MADGRISCKILAVERQWCPHCKQHLSLKTYKAHERMYYDPVRRYWFAKTSTMTDEAEEEASSNNSSNDIYSESPPLSEGDAKMDASINPLSNESSLSKRTVTTHIFVIT